MMGELGQYIISLCAAGILCSLLIGIASRQTAHKKLIAFLCGISMVITVASPWVTIRLKDISTITNRFHTEAFNAVISGQDYAKETLSDIIRSRSEAYILDKATAMGVQLNVNVELTEDHPGTPCRIYLRGSIAPYAKAQLIDYIYTTLGIAKENQIWT